MFLMIKTRVNFHCVELKQRYHAWRSLWDKLYTDDLEERLRSQQR